MTKKVSSKNMPWSGWPKTNPHYHERTLMIKKCGKRCFLGKDKSFPICDKGTCNVNDKGIWAAYVRSREFGSPRKIKTSKKHGKSYYRKIANRSKKMLKARGYDVGKRRTRKNILLRKV